MAYADDDGTGYRDGLRVITEFIGNGFGIDPEGCGCTDCLTGQTIYGADDDMLARALAQGRPLYNRTSRAVLLPNGVILEPGESWNPEGKHCSGCQCYQHRRGR